MFFLSNRFIYSNTFAQYNVCYGKNIYVYNGSHLVENKFEIFSVAVIGLNIDYRRILIGLVEYFMGKIIVSGI